MSNNSTNTITIGRRLIPIEHVAYLEPFDNTGPSRIETGKAFQTRVVLLDRESVLTEEAPDALAERHGFRWLSEDGVVVNPAVRFRVEAFEPLEGFNPPKPYRSRLMWRDHDGETQSKLLMTSPETLLDVVVRGEGGAYASSSGKPRRLQASSLRNG